MLEEPWTRVEPPTTLKTMLDAYERRIIASALAATAGNQRRAAASLGLLPTTLHEKMKRLGLRADPFLPAGVRDEAASGSDRQRPAPDGEANL